MVWMSEVHPISQAEGKATQLERLQFALGGIHDFLGASSSPNITHASQVDSFDGKAINAMRRILGSRLGTRTRRIQLRHPLLQVSPDQRRPEWRESSAREISEGSLACRKLKLTNYCNAPNFHSLRQPKLRAITCQSATNVLTLRVPIQSEEPLFGWGVPTRCWNCRVVDSVLAN